MAKFIVSRIDERLTRFFLNRKKTESESKEMEKNSKVMELRDKPKSKNKQRQDDIWSDF